MIFAVAGFSTDVHFFNRVSAPAPQPNIYLSVPLAIEITPACTTSKRYQPSRPVCLRVSTVWPRSNEAAKITELGMTRPRSRQLVTDVID
jgi:hypothetical protein